MALNQGRAIGDDGVDAVGHWVFGFASAAMLIAFQRRGDEMQRDRKGVVLWCCLAASVLCAPTGSVFAQSQGEPVPDYAALIGLPVTAAEVVKARSAPSTTHDVQRRLDAAGVRRTAADRAASEGLNLALAKMPETMEQALREAAADKSGAGIVLTSRQELEPLYAVPSRGGRYPCLARCQ